MMVFHRFNLFSVNRHFIQFNKLPLTYDAHFFPFLARYSRGIDDTCVYLCDSRVCVRNGQMNIVGNTPSRRNINQVVQRMRDMPSSRVRDVTDRYRDASDSDDYPMSSDNEGSRRRPAHTAMAYFDDDDERDDEEDARAQQLLRNRFFNNVMNDHQRAIPSVSPAVLDHVHISNLPGADTTAATTTTTTTTILTKKKGGVTAEQAKAGELKSISLGEAYSNIYGDTVVKRREHYREIGYDEPSVDSGDEDGDSDDSQNDSPPQRKRRRERMESGDEEDSERSGHSKKRKKRCSSCGGCGGGDSGEGGDNSQQLRANRGRTAPLDCFLCTWGNEHYDGLSVPHINELFRLVKTYHGAMQNTDLAQMVHLYYKENVYDPSQGMKMLYPSTVQDHLENYHSLSASTFIIESMRRYQRAQFLVLEKLCFEDGSVNPKQLAMMGVCQNQMLKLFGANKRAMILDPEYNPEELKAKARDINLVQRFSYQDERQGRVRQKTINNAVGSEITRFEL